MPHALPRRLHSLDQFRGYTIAGMFLVNYLAGFAVTPAILRHHNTWLSYADTVMPQFFFAVGFALRLAFLRHADRLGPAAARRLRRFALLIAVGAVVYHLDDIFRFLSHPAAFDFPKFFTRFFERSLFQALVHIALASLWCLPAITRPARFQIAWAAASGLAHLALSAAFYHDWLRAHRVIDGGPLGFLTWSLPLLTGSLTHLYLERRGREAPDKPLLFAAAALTLAGYALACLTAGGVLAAPPFFAPWHPRDLWTMSQQSGSLSYLLCSSGLSLAVYVFFLWWTGVRNRQFALFRTLGVNALAAYVISLLLEDPVKLLAPRDSSAPWALATFLLFFLLCWAPVRYMERRQWFWRL
jgi:predicted acyltransferase